MTTQEFEEELKDLVSDYLMTNDVDNISFPQICKAATK